MKPMTDAQVEEEISRILGSEPYKVCKTYENHMNKRRNYLYALRQKEKKGRELMKSGFTVENIEEMEDMK